MSSPKPIQPHVVVDDDTCWPPKWHIGGETIFGQAREKPDPDNQKRINAVPPFKLKDLKR